MSDWSVETWLVQHWVEIFGFVTGVTCVYLAARRNIWNFPVGILSSVVFLVLFVDYQLYADAGLQVVFVVLCVAGWIAWNGARANDDRAATRRVPLSAVPLLVGAALVITVSLSGVLFAFTDSSTQVADASTTAASLVAQFMMNKRWIESWYVWIGVDVAYIALYAFKGLWITGILYLIFIGVCLVGLRTWRAAPHLIADAKGSSLV